MNLVKLKELEEITAALESEKAMFERLHPQRYELLKRQILESKEGTNRWIDNIFAIAQYIKKARPEYADEELESAFPIFKNLEFVE